MFFTGCTVCALQGNPSTNTWHSFIVIYKDQQIFIYNPDYSPLQPPNHCPPQLPQDPTPKPPQMRHISTFTGLNLTRNL